MDAAPGAIAKGARQYQDTNGRDERIPGVLSYYRRHVEEAVQTQAATPAPPKSPPPAERDGSMLAELAWIGQQETDARRREAYRAAWRVLKSAGKDSRAVLSEANHAAVEAFTAQLSVEEQAQLVTLVEERLAPELPTLGRRGLALRQRAIHADIVRTQYGLVRLTPDE